MRRSRVFIQRVESNNANALGQRDGRHLNEDDTSGRGDMAQEESLKNIDVRMGSSVTVNTPDGMMEDTRRCARVTGID